MPDAIPAQGVVLEIGNGASPEVFTAVAQILDGNGPNRSRTMIDATSTDDDDEKFIAGIRKGGQVQLTVHLIGADGGQNAIITAFGAGTLDNYRIELTDSPQTVLSFAAYVSALGGPQWATDGKVTRTITLQVSGAVTES